MYSALVYSALVNICVSYGLVIHRYVRYLEVKLTELDTEDILNIRYCRDNWLGYDD